MADVPQVTGLRPSIGPSTGGTLVTIRGSDLGESEEDVLDVTIGGVSVRESLRYLSSSKLQCTTAPCSQASGPVVVTTTAGRGISHVTFVFEEVESDNEEESQTIGMLTESKVWKEEVMEDDHGLSMAPASSIDRDPLNLQLEESRKPLRGEMKSRVQELEAQVGGGSHLLSETDFKPSLCLVRLYRDCTKKELKKGLRHLEELEEENDRAFKQLINVSSTTFVGAFEAVLNTNRRIKFHKRTLNSASITSKLAESIRKLEEETHVTYDAILDRKQEADRHRTMLQVLAAHRFLFNLPRSLRDSISRHEWTHAILDLGKARRLFSDPDVSAFHKVKATIEEIAEEVKATLYKQLSCMPLPLATIEELTSHLVTLDPDSEPGWHAIQQLQSFILSETERLVGELANASASLSSPGKRRWSRVRAAVRMRALSHMAQSSSSVSGSGTSSLASWRSSLDASGSGESGGTSKSDADTQLSLLQTKQRIEDADKPPRILFAEHVCSVAMEYCPMLWRLGNTCYPPLDEDDDGDSSRLSTPRRPKRHSAMYQGMFDAPDRSHMDMQRLLVRRKQIKDYVETATLRVTSLLRQNLLRAQDDESLENANARVLLPRLASRISGCCKVMRAEKLPEECITGFQDVLTELYHFTINTVFRIAQKEIQQLVDKEDWTPLEDGTRTGLPDKFAHILTNTLHSLKEFASASTANADALDKVNVEELICSAFSSFAHVLSTLATAPVETAHNRSSLSVDDQDRGSVSSAQDEAAEKMHTKQHRLLCIISNTFYTRDVVAGMLTADLDDLRVDLNDAFDATLETYSQLQRQLMDNLVDLQAKSFVTILRHNATSGLKSLPQQLSVRPYVMLILFELVLLHHQITNTAKGFTARILAAVTEQLATGMLHAVRHATVTSSRVVAQLHVEVLVFQRVLHAFDSDPSMWAGVLKLLATKASAVGKRAGARSGRRLPSPGARRGDLSSPTPAPSLNITAEMEHTVDAFVSESRVHLQCLMQQQADLSDSDVEV